MAKKYKTVLCQCSECAENVFVDEFGHEQRGEYQRPQVAQKHAHNDIVRREQGDQGEEGDDEQMDQDNIEENIVLAMLFANVNPDTELPTRPSDKEAGPSKLQGSDSQVRDNDWYIYSTNSMSQMESPTSSPNIASKPDIEHEQVRLLYLNYHKADNRQDGDL